ncbi:MAG: hypothetical protein BVN34_08370 [Proteobacteria bacterium ST_bin12]|nr:MAG: hypothetical protein BVN34_08370 [Proteobacteria bacterium ST_bin12]
MLSARRSKFVEQYILHHNGSKAARDAGYAVSGARVTAHRLLTDANVKAEIAAKSQDLAREYELNKAQVIKEIQAAIKLANNQLDPGAMIKGWVEVGKLMGHYLPEKVEIRASPNQDVIKAKLEALTDEQLMEIINGSSL